MKFNTFAAASGLAFLLVACGGGEAPARGQSAAPAPASAASAPASAPAPAPTPAQITLLAGSTGGPGNIDGDASVAQLAAPYELHVDANGDLIVRDVSVGYRRVTPAGVVTTLPAQPDDFYAIKDAQGNTYEQTSCALWKISPTQQKTLVAGVVGECATVDGPPGQGRLQDTSYAAAAPDGTVYLLDWTDGNRIRKITASGAVTTLAGGPAAPAQDGQGSDARFEAVWRLAADGLGNVYVVDASQVRRIDAAGNVTTLNLTGAVPAQTFLHNIAVDVAGNVYIAYGGASFVSVVRPGSTVATLFAGKPLDRRRQDGAGSEARFEDVQWAALDNDGSILVPSFSQEAGLVIRRVARDGRVTTELYPETANAVNPSHRIVLSGYAFDRARGVHYLAEWPSLGCLCLSDGGVIWRVGADGRLAEFVGKNREIGDADGQGATARFGRWLTGPVVDTAGNLYVIDGRNLRKVTPDGAVSTIARDFLPQPENVTGRGLAVDGAGNVYVLDHDHALRKVTPQGQVFVVAGASGQAGHVDGHGAAARFDNNFSGYQMAVDAAGKLYVGEQGACAMTYHGTLACSGAIRRVTPDGDVTTLAGTLGRAGIVTGDAPGAIYAPKSMVWTPDGLVVGSGWSLLRIR